MQVERLSLLRALELVKPGLSRQENIAQATRFAFVHNRVVTYNDEISVSHPVPDLSLTGAILAEGLYKWLGEVRGNKIKLEIDEAQLKATAAGGRSKSTYTLQSEITMPLGEIGELGDWHPCPTGLKAALQFAMFSCGVDMSQPTLTCVHACKEGRIESGDNYRLTRYVVDPLPINTFLIPAKSVRHLLNYEFNEMAEGNGWVHFRTKEGTIFSARVFGDVYPNITELLNVEGKEVQLPPSLVPALQRISHFAKREHVLDEQITVEIQSNRLTLKAENLECSGEESVKVDYNDPTPISFVINPNLFSDIVGKVDKGILGTACLKFEAGKWQHVVALHAE